ncbi:MAG: SCP2 sterol-binding domain-containing protein [Pseudomonadota bacterium]
MSNNKSELDRDTGKTDSTDVQSRRAHLMTLAEDIFDVGFGAVIEIGAHELEPFFIDGRGEKATVISDAPSADCTWRGPEETLVSVFQKNRALQNAYLSGRLVIGGDMSVMARLTLST